ncbi:Uncharacterised protein [Acinetobacter baumannii]|nr:Uncharacterised protein [Acinetobacter baumannii]
MVRPQSRPHLLSPLVMNWSMTTWAPLAKSPNWASQITSEFGVVVAKPYSNASTASSERKES